MHKNLKLFRSGNCWKCKGELSELSFDEMECDGYLHRMTAYKCDECGQDYTEYESEDPRVRDHVDDCTWEEA